MWYAETILRLYKKLSSNWLQPKLVATQVASPQVLLGAPDHGSLS